MQRQSLTISHKQTDAQLVSEQWSRRKTTPPHTHTFLLRIMMLYGREYSFDQLASAVLAVSAPSILPTQATLLRRAGRVGDGESLEH